MRQGKNNISFGFIAQTYYYSFSPSSPTSILGDSKNLLRFIDDACLRKSGQRLDNVDQSYPVPSCSYSKKDE